MMLARAFTLPRLLVLVVAAACGGSESAPTGTPAAVQGVTLSSTSAQLTVGSTVQLTATVSITGSASTAVDWSSSNSAVASVAAGVVTGVSAGTATITATSQFDRTKSSSAVITVSPAGPPTISSMTPSAILVSSAPQTLTVTGTGFQAGMTLVLTTPRYGGGTLTYGPGLISSVTPTSFQVAALFGVQGNYSLQITSATGVKSNAFATTAQFRTSGATWIPEGVRLTDSTSGFPGGGIADVAAIHMQDGRWRLIYNSINSAITTDGLKLTVETPSHGLRNVTPDGSIAQLPRVIQLATGQWRVYFGCCSGAAAGIYSAITSDDGLTWTLEPGARILLSAANITLPQAFLSGLSIVKLRDGRWRGYFADQAPQTIPGTPIVMKSATSTDLLNWTVDPGVRIGTGAPSITGVALHPKAILNADSSITVFYYGFTPIGAALYASTSTDGLTFTTQTQLEALGEGGDPEIVQMGSALRMYYNWGDDKGGAIYSALNATGAATTRVKRP